MSYQIQPLTKNSAFERFVEIAQLHQLEIPGGFLTAFGSRFLQSLYYALACSDHAFLYGAHVEERCVAFVAGVLNKKMFYQKFLLKKSLTIVQSLLPKFFSLGVIRESIQFALSRNSQAIKCVLPPAEIFNLCVHPLWQRKGIGTELYQTALAAFQHQGVDLIVTKLGVNQFKAHLFHQAMNAQQITQFDHQQPIEPIMFLSDCRPRNILNLSPAA